MSNPDESSSSGGGSGSGSSPPAKKQRERKPVDMSKMIVTEESSDEDWYYLPEGETVVNHEVWDKYLKQIAKSEGFDIKDFPVVCYYTSIVPIDLNEIDDKVESLPELARFAIQEYNKQNVEAS